MASTAVMNRFRVTRVNLDLDIQIRERERKSLALLDHV